MMDGQIESGTVDFAKRRGESNGSMFLRFNGWLHREFHNNLGDLKGKIDLIVYERAHHRGGAATEIGVGMATRVMEFAAYIGAEYMGVHSATIKKYVTGSGRANKDDMIAWFEKTQNRSPVDDNEADAMALLYFALNEMGEPKPAGHTPKAEIIAYRA